MRRRRIFSLLLAVVLILGLSGCRDSVDRSESSLEAEQNAPAEQNNTMQLLYSAADTFHPYTAVTAVNRELCELLFDPLFKTDNSFAPIYCLAASAENSGTTCTVSLRPAQFTDGSSVTAQDVVYSCNLARQTAGAISAKLSEIAAVSAADSQTVVFRLTHSDPYFLNLLDFPIIKENSDKISDADGVLKPPVGCGRFQLSETGDALVRNNGYYGAQPAITRIRLINAPDAESIAHYVEIGATDAYYTDMADGQIVRMSGKKTDVNLTDFVYLGINSTSPVLSVPEVRYAISSALDRTAICKSAYYNNAVAATGFFHPAFSDTAAVQTLKNTADSKIAIENLEKIGYNRVDSIGYRVNSAGRKISVTLLVNSENASRKAAAALIAEQLKAVGIELQIRELGYDAYLAALASGSFELYLGEVRLNANMDLSPLVLAGGAVAYGVSESEQQSQEDIEASSEQSGEGQDVTEVKNAVISEIYAAFYAGEVGVKDLASALLTELPAIPICYREGLLFYDDGVCALSGASQSDIFLSIAAH